MEFIKAQSPAWKNKLVSENVTESTLNFPKGLINNEIP